jgi:transcriptional regulator with XRE-family HTH domain
MVRLIDIPPGEQAARIRAAIGHSGLESREVAKRLGVSYATLRRRYDRNEPSGVASVEELHAIADVCGVPRAFMEEGYARFVDGAELAGRVTQLEAQAAAQARELLRAAETADANRVAIEGLLPEIEDRLEALAREAIEQVRPPARADARRAGKRQRAG